MKRVESERGIAPSPLKFSVEVDDVVMSSVAPVRVKITNHDAMAIAFKLCTRHPSWYVMRPRHGVVAPGQTATLVVTLKPPPDAVSAARQCSGSFGAQSAESPGRAPSAGRCESLASSRAGGSGVAPATAPPSVEGDELMLDFRAALGALPGGPFAASRPAGRTADGAAVPALRIATASEGVAVVPPPAAVELPAFEALWATAARLQQRTFAVRFAHLTAAEYDRRAASLLHAQHSAVEAHVSRQRALLGVLREDLAVRRAANAAYAAEVREMQRLQRLREAARVGPAAGPVQRAPLNSAHGEAGASGGAYLSTWLVSVAVLASFWLGLAGDDARAGAAFPDGPVVALVRQLFGFAG